jgi:hypothetical protein
MKSKACALTIGLLMAASSTITHATAPPPSWTNLRTIVCDGVELTAYLGPPGFGTPFNLVGSTDVIIPKHVEVTFEGQTFVTRDVPGFDPSRADVVYCQYTDPVGLFVEFLGIRK